MTEAQAETLVDCFGATIAAIGVIYILLWYYNKIKKGRKIMAKAVKIDGKIVSKEEFRAWFLKLQAATRDIREARWREQEEEN